MNKKTQQLQALLFAAGEAVPKKELSEILGEPIESVHSYIQELTAALEGHGLALATTDTHIQLVTAPAVADFLSRFQQEELGELTKAAAETLAIIAYRGPLSRYDIDVLRGVDSRSMIRSLMRRGVVRRLQRAGRTPLYDVTEDFLLNLGIQNREQLPDFVTLSNTEAIQHLLTSQEHGNT